MAGVININTRRTVASAPTTLAPAPMPTVIEVRPFNDDVASVILVGDECEGLDYYCEYAIWRMKQAAELVLRTFVWLAVHQSDVKIKTHLISEAEDELIKAATSQHPDTFELADAYFNRIKKYCERCREIAAKQVEEAA